MKKLFGMLAIAGAVLCSGCYHELKPSYKLHKVVDDIQKVQPVLSNMVNRVQSRGMTVVRIEVWSNGSDNYSIYVDGRDNDDFIEER